MSFQKFKSIVSAKDLQHSRAPSDDFNDEGSDNGEDLGVVMYELDPPCMSEAINKDDLIEMAQGGRSMGETQDIKMNEVEEG